MPEQDSDIHALRARLTAIDHRILELVAERQKLVEAIGRDKRSRGQQTRDFRREKEVIDGVPWLPQKLTALGAHDRGLAHLADPLIADHPGTRPGGGRGSGQWTYRR